MALEMKSPRGGGQSPRGGGGRGGRGGGGRGFGGGRGAPRGFRGGNMRGGDRGGMRGSRGGGRGGDRGGRGSFRGDRGGSMTGGFRGSSRGSFRGSPRGGRGGSHNFNDTQKPGFANEVALGLQLRVLYKGDVPSEEETMKQLSGLHSRFTKTNDASAQYLLFKDLESLESAKEKLEKDDNVSSVDYNGMRSSKNSGNSPEFRQLYMRFDSSVDEEEIKKLDNKIVSVTIGIEKTSCLVEYATPKEAEASFKILSKAKDLPGNCKFVRMNHALQNRLQIEASCSQNMIVLRDVPKQANISHFAELFPEAISLTIYNKTFPASTYCHAAVGFPSNDMAKNFLSDEKHREILGKKIYIFPAYASFLAEMPKLGEPWPEDQKSGVKIPGAADVEQSPSKKMKLENDKNKVKIEADNEEDEDMESANDENGDAEADENGEGEDEEGEGDDEEGDEEEDDDDDDDDDDEDDE